MKPDKSERISRFLLSLISFTVYIALFIAVMAKAFNTDLYHFILS